MRSKSSSPMNIKLILFTSFLILLLLLIITTLYSSSSSKQNPELKVSSNSTEAVAYDQQQPAEDSSSERSTYFSPCPPSDHPLLPHSLTCNKIPPSLANALVHYATTNATPQQTSREISVSLRVLEKKCPCNFLVFGLGHDSLMWSALNHGGRTVFLEEDKAWIEKIQEKLPTLESYHVEYDTRVDQSDDLMKIGIDDEECRVVTDPRFSKCKLALKGFPSDVYDVEWDLIMVDAPTGFHDGAPGRMTAIYTAGLMARNRESGETDVFVHDVDRKVEDGFSKRFLCEGYLTEQEGRIRHFTIPSHKTRAGRPFCP